MESGPTIDEAGWSWARFRSIWHPTRPALISVDAVPFTIRFSVLDGLLGAAYGLPFVALGLYWLAGTNSNFLVAPAMFTAFGLSNLLPGLWRVPRPDSMTLSAEGLEYRTLWRVGRWRWTEVRNFRETKERGPRILFEDLSPARPPLLMSPRRIRGDWPGLNVTGTVRLLNRAKARFDPADQKQLKGRQDGALSLDTI